MTAIVANAVDSESSSLLAGGGNLKWLLLLYMGKQLGDSAEGKNISWNIFQWRSGKKDAKWGVRRWVTVL